MPEPRRKRAAWRWLIGLVACGLFVSVLIPTVLAVRRLSKPLTCLTNLKSLATAYGVYARSLPGAPFTTSDEAVQAMIDARLVSREQTLSPLTGRQFVLVTPGEFPGLTTCVDNRDVVAYEPLAGPDATHGCIVFADGHGECVRAERHRAIVAAGRDER
jgi:hypothetical protein